MDCQREGDAEHEHGHSHRIYYTIYAIHEVSPSFSEASRRKGPECEAGEKRVGWCFKLLRPVFLTAMGVFGSQPEQDITGLVVVQPGGPATKELPISSRDDADTS
jgi:hypothetical protein